MANQHVPLTASVSAETNAGAAVLSKVQRRLIPFMCLLYLLAYIDRVNVGFAALQMTGDLRLSDAVYGFGTGIFFIGYFLFEIPSNLILERTGARVWIARIMITWGIVAACMALVRGPWSFYALRFIPGIAEAGFFPGMVLYLTYWFPPACRARTTALFFTSTAVAGVIGGPVSGLLLTLNGVGGMRGWQWLFVLEGIPSVLAGVVVYFFLTDRPAHARWLTQRERDWLIDEPQRTEPIHAHQGEPQPQSHLKLALRDARLWQLSAVYFMLMIGLYGVSYWMPKVLKKTTGYTDLQVGMAAAIPYTLAVVAMILIGRHSDRTRERRWHVAFCSLAAAAGFALTPCCHSSATALAALSLAAIGVWSAVGPFWAVPGEFLRGTAAAAGIAAINSLGCLGGFVGPYVVGLLKTNSAGFTSGLLFTSAALVAGALLIVSLRTSEVP